MIPPRERLLETAAALFYAEGIHGVGVDRLLEEAGVTRATMYRHFTGKQALVEAYLEREDALIRGSFAATGAAADNRTDLLEALIDGIAEDARRHHRRGCPFINAAAEYPDPDGPVRQLIDGHRAWFRNALTSVCKSAGIPRPAQVAAALVLLRDATLVGVYLDGDAVTSTFRRTARQLAGLD